jgi:isoquinoline 1-oxidoreductase
MGDDRLDRPELFAGPAYQFEVARRTFLKVFGSGIAIACVTPVVADAQRGGSSPTDRPQQLGAWLHIGTDGRVTAYTGKTEVGQNIRTSLTQGICEELRVGAELVTLVMADTSRTPFGQGTFGSRTTPDMNLQLRRAAATARRALIAAAAQRLSVDASALEAVNGAVVHGPSRRRVTYQDLATDRTLLTVIEAGPLRAAATWTTLGRPALKVNGADVVTGRHRYVSDLTRPKMLYGSVLRPPSTGAVLQSVDTAAAQRLPGVRVVRDGTFVGVVAPSRREAEQARAAITAKWTESAGPSSTTIFEAFKRQRPATAGEGRTLLPSHVVGSPAEALKAASRVVTGTYTVAYIAHAPMEPRAAVAEWTGGALTVWTATQRPFGVRDELAAAFHLPPDRVRVLVPDAGSAYGGKHTGEAATEAARLAQGAGVPVKLVWTRQEEFAHAYFRPAGVVDVKSGVQADGTIVAFEFDSFNAGPAAIRPIYDFAHQRFEMHPTESPLRVGSYRGLAATANHFVRETHLDEVAVATGIDPLDLRIRNLRDDRQKTVLVAAAERAGWTSRPRSGHRAMGIACGCEKGSYVATVAEVSLDRNGLVSLARLVVAFECGAIVNPNGLNAQVEGAVVQGIGGALFERIEFENGRITNGRFATYRVPRFTDVPPIEIVLLNRVDLPSAGAGETPIVAVAPAIGNAIFAASGVRLRDLPLVPNSRLTRA